MDLFFAAFSEMDENNDGQITQEEFVEVSSLLEEMRKLIIL